MTLNKNYCDFFPKIVSSNSLKYYLKPEVLNNNLETFIIIDNFKIQGLIINNQYINEIPEAYFLTEFTPFLECLKNTLDNQNFFIVQNDVHDYLGCIKLSTIIKHIATVTTHNPNAHVCLIGTNNHRNNSNELLRIFAKENIEVQHFQVLQSNSSSAIYPNYFIYCQIANVDEDHFFILLKKYNFYIEYHKKPQAQFSNSKKSFDYLMNFINLDVAHV